MIDVFSYPDIQFPEGFLWGASTAGAQVEGNLRSFYDDPETAPKEHEGKPYVFPGMACDSFARYEEDFALLRRMNLNLYRFSVEWSRIEPEKGAYDEAALARYIHMLEALRASGIKACVTLHHFAHPVWFHKQGHFDTLDNLPDWARYLEYIVPKLAPLVDYWIILNEPNLPFVYTLGQRLNLMHYHAQGYGIVKKHSTSPASSALSYSAKQPLRGTHDRLDSLVAQVEDFNCNEFFFHAIRTGEVIAPYHEGRQVPGLKDSCDFWALNCYVRHMIDGRKAFPLAPHYQATTFKPLTTGSHMDEIWPELIIDMLMRAKDKPCMITENGLATDDDDFRIVYIASMLQALRQSMDLGADVLGYSYWSLLDNWEWGSYDAPFGLAAVNFDTFARTLRPSGAFYGDVAKANGLRQTDLRAHLNALPTAKKGEA